MGEKKKPYMYTRLYMNRTLPRKWKVSQRALKIDIRSIWIIRYEKQKANRNFQQTKTKA